MAAARDENSDTSRTGPGPTRESKMEAIPDYLLHEEPVVTGSRATLKKDQPRG